MVVAGVHAACGCLIAIYNMMQHFRHFFQASAAAQRRQVPPHCPDICSRILLLLVYPQAQLYLVSLRDIYEAYIIYLFLVLIIDLAGGDSHCASALAEDLMRHPEPMLLSAKIQAWREISEGIVSRRVCSLFL